MLKIYTSIEDVQKDNKELIRINDSFFNSETSIIDSLLVRDILTLIDKAEYNSDLTFIGRTKKLGALNKNMLSTGTKTLLNILSFPDICFDVCECGDNALSFLPKIREGNILWELPIAIYQGEPACDIECNGQHFTNFYKFLESVGE